MRRSSRRSPYPRLRTSPFWKISFGLFACGFSMNLIGTHGMPILMDHGFDATTSSLGIGLIGLVAVLRHPRRRLRRATRRRALRLCLPRTPDRRDDQLLAGRLGLRGDGYALGQLRQRRGSAADRRRCLHASAAAERGLGSPVWQGTLTAGPPVAARLDCARRLPLNLVALLVSSCSGPHGLPSRFWNSILILDVINSRNGAGPAPPQASRPPSN